MVRIAIVDDETVHQQKLKQYVSRYMEGQKKECSFTFFSNADDLLDGYNYSFDVIFLDIDMGTSNGMEAAKYLRRNDRQVILIFATRLAQYAMEGYKVNALGYILKPIDYYNVEMVMTQAMYVLSLLHRSLRIIVMNDEGKQVIDSSALRYIEVRDHMLIYHTEDGEYHDWGSMAKREKELVPYRFFRCHRCFLINLSHVSGISSDQGDMVRIGKEQIPVSRNRKPELMSAMIHFLEDQGGMMP